MKGDFLRNPLGQRFSSLNHRVLGRTPTDLSNFYWFERDTTHHDSARTGDLSWQQQQLPFTSSSFFAGTPVTNLQWNAKAVAILPTMRTDDEDADYKGTAWHEQSSTPDRIVMCPKVWIEYPFVAIKSLNRRVKPLSINEYFQDYRAPGMRAIVSVSTSLLQLQMGIVPLWTDTPRHGVRPSPWGLECRFPPNWSTICGIRFDGYGDSRTKKFIWNPSHALIRWLDSSAWKWVSSFGRDLNPLSHRDQLLVSPPRAAAWMLRCLLDGAHEMWDALKERDPLFLAGIWKILFPDSPPSSSVYVWLEEGSSGRLRVLNTTSWNVYDSEHQIFATVFPEPASEWRLFSAK